MDDAVQHLRSLLGPGQPRIDASTVVRAAHAHDASLHRVAPAAVAWPRNSDDVAALVAAAAQCGLPVTARGAGTSCAGNAIGPGLVLDLRALDNVSVDPQTRTVHAGAGATQMAVQRAAAAHGLRCGPDPSTASRCTIGGMIGNNACGARALGYGRTADVLVDASLVLADGTRTTSSKADWGPMWALADQHLAVIRRELGTFSRQVSGYSLEHLLPEQRGKLTPRLRTPPDLTAPENAGGARFWAGTEGTLALVTSATLALAPEPVATVVAVMGFASMTAAADAVPALLRHSPTACEGLDDRIVAVARLRGRSVPDLPRGRGYLLVECAAASPGEATAAAKRIVSDCQPLDHRIASGEQAEALWRVRSEGAGLAAVAMDRPGQAGWEDAAVPVHRLGAYLREFEELLVAHGLHALSYGHFGEGCIHARIDFPLDRPDGAVRYRRFIEQAADLVAAHGGSASGEHGDGRARSELLGRMYSPEVLALFAAVKHHWDPTHLLNPGVLVDPAPLDANMTAAACLDSPLRLTHPGFVEGAHRCTGVGSCVSHEKGTMCPSFKATGAEQHSTRGRARVLQELVVGELVSDWHDPAVAEALEWCLACKACASECPTGVDMAALKSVALQERYRGRLRPLWHHLLGQMPRWTRLLQRHPGLARMAAGLMATPLPRWGSPLLGLAPLTRWPALAPIPSAPLPTSVIGPPVALWVDSFSQAFGADHVLATARVLERAGFAVQLVDRDVCCGLTWITTGQRDTAARKLRHAVDVLAPLAHAGIPVVGTEPSCTMVWRSDAAELLPDRRDDVAAVADAVTTLPEFLHRHRVTLPPWQGPPVVIQPHCHERAMGDASTTSALLASVGAEVTTLEGCCGMAGTFGMEASHARIARDVASLELLPALVDHPDAVMIADGFSCRTQLGHLATREVFASGQALWDTGLWSTEVPLPTSSTKGPPHAPPLQADDHHH